jgi:beta-ribofuranosylaminobenzene 5'-phosphate synthase
MDSVSVSVPARLHLGFLDINGSLGRKFGSLGLALSEPQTRLTMRRSDRMRVLGVETERAERYLKKLLETLRDIGDYELEVSEAIPPHAGLGSGTQLALAIAAAVRKLKDLHLDPRADAAMLGRGMRSGIGVGLFHTGGVVLDGGRGSKNTPPPVLASYDFPEDWRILLVLDGRTDGVYGSEEIAAFKELPEFPEAEAAYLCRLMLMQTLPALVEQDLALFGAAITEMQTKLGDYFAPVQGGRFTSTRVGDIVSTLWQLGAHGCGQSSWGPTGFAFAADRTDAERLKSLVEPEAQASGVIVKVVKGNNKGAAISSQIEE